MAQTVLLKHSNTAGNTPTLADGEIAIQQADGALYWRTAAAAVRRILFPKRMPVAGVSYTISPSDVCVAVTSISASLVLTLPTASAYPVGHVLVVADESGACNVQRTITIAAAGTDKVSGAASLQLSVGYGFYGLTSDGVSKWTIVSGIPNAIRVGGLTTTGAPAAPMIAVGTVGAAGAANIAAVAPGTAQSQAVGYDFYPTFTGTGDNNPRRAATIQARFNGTAWGGEVLDFMVGQGGAANDTTAVPLTIFSLSSQGASPKPLPVNQGGTGSGSAAAALSALGAAPTASPSFTGTATFGGSATFSATVAFNGSASLGAGQFAFIGGATGSVATLSGDGARLQVRAGADANGNAYAAAMNFHRPGAYATWFGLDTDNEFVRGGWSDGLVRYRFWTEKNFNPANYAVLNGPTFTNAIGVNSGSPQINLSNPNSANANWSIWNYSDGNLYFQTYNGPTYLGNPVWFDRAGNVTIAGQYNGGVNGLTYTATSESTSVARPAIKKLREWLFFGERKNNITGNGTADDTAAAQDDIIYAANAKIPLYFEDNMVIGTTGTLYGTGWNRIKGRGGVLQKNNSNPNGLGSYTGFNFNHNAIGLQFNPPDTNTFDRCGLKDFVIVRPQPAATYGNAWSPNAADFDIDFTQTSGSVDGVECLRSTNFLRIQRNYGNQVFVDRIKGQVFNSGIQVLSALDNVYIGQVHFWPFWTGGLGILSARPVLLYQLANHYGVQVGRADGLTMGEIFTFAANATVLIDYYNGGSDSGLAGTVNNGSFRKIYNDNGVAAIVNRNGSASGFILRGAVVESYGAPVNAAGPNGTTVPYYTGTGNVIDTAAANGNLVIGQFWSNNAPNSHAAAQGANTTIDIAQFTEGGWNLRNTGSAGLVGANGGKIIVGSWKTADASTAPFSNVPTNVSKFAGSVRGKISQGIATNIAIDANGNGYWPHSAGPGAPTFARVTVISGGAQGAVTSKPNGMDGTNIGRTFYNAAGAHLTACNDVTVEWEAWAGF
jgi:hypothetical protein